MKQPLPRLRSCAFFLFGGFLLFLLLKNSDLAMDGVRRGLSLCAQTLFPSLFPFLVLSELLIRWRADEVLGRWFSRPVSALFGLSAGGATALLLGALCGFPVGTTVAVSLTERGQMHREELERLLLFANNPSSGFLVSAVGEALFGNRGAGVALFLITWASAICVGIFLRLVAGPVTKDAQSPALQPPQGFSVSDLTGSITGAFSALLQVFSFVVFFSCVAGCLAPTVAALSLPPAAGVMLYGLLELTSGISAAVTTLSPAAAFRAAAFFSSFAGLSVCLQLFSVAEQQRPRLTPYLLARMAQGGLSLLFAEAYLFFCKPEFILSQSVGRFLTYGKTESPLTLPLFFILFLFALSLLWRATRKRKGAPGARRM